MDEQTQNAAVVEASSLRGHPVMDLSQGKQIGTVADTLLDDGGKVAGFDISLPGAMGGHRFLPFSRVRALGEDAVTVDAGNGLGDVPGKGAGIASTRALEGRRVLTDAGDALGTVADVVLNRADGSIAALALSNGGGRNYLPWTARIQPGQDVVLVPAEARATLRPDYGGAAATWERGTAEGNATMGTDNINTPQDDDRTEAEYQYVIGRVTQRAVLLDGEVVVPAGREVTAGDAAGALAAGVLEDLAFAVAAGNMSQTNVHGSPDNPDGFESLEEDAAEAGR